MKLTIQTLTLFFLTTMPLAWTMENSQHRKKSTSCQNWLTSLVLGGALERSLVTAHISAHRFSPFTQEMHPIALQLFAKKGIALGNARLVDLETDQHLAETAKKADLGGLFILEAKTSKTYTLHDALTANSITHFHDGIIYHGIVVPTQIYQELHSNKNEQRPILLGMVEREIARIRQSYSENDLEIRELKQNLGWTAYSILAAAAACFEPFTLIATAPLGLALNSVLKEKTEIAHECDLDAQAAELAETTDHLVATLKYSTNNQVINDAEFQSAQRKADDEQYSGFLSLRAQRVCKLLKLQREMKKNQ